MQLLHSRFRHSNLGGDGLLARAEQDARRVLHVAGRIAALRRAREEELVAQARRLAPERLGLPEPRGANDPVLRMAQHRPSDALSAGDLANALLLHFAGAAPALPGGATRDEEGWNQASHEASEAWGACFEGGDEGEIGRLARPWSYRWAAFFDAGDAVIDVPVLLSSLDDKHLFTFACTQEYTDGLVTFDELLQGMRAHLTDGGARRLVPIEVNDIEVSMAGLSPIGRWALAWPRYEGFFRTPISLFTHLGAGAAALSFEGDRLDEQTASSTLRALLGLSRYDAPLSHEGELTAEPLPLQGAQWATLFKNAARVISRGGRDKGHAEIVGRELFLALVEHETR